jgi:CBS domain-containing protein
MLAVNRKEEAPLQPLLEQTLHDIDRAAHWGRLRAIKSSLSQAWSPETQAISDPTELFEYNAGLNQLHDRIISRTIELAELELLNSKLAPPCSYAFVLFGSGGRGEQSIFSDQDNGIIYAEPSPEAEHYFERLGSVVQDALQSIGYPPCTGKVVCGYSRWRRPLSGWLGQLLEWAQNPTWENTRYLLIVADLRAVYGDPCLADQVARCFRALPDQNHELLPAMMRNTQYHKPAAGLFGNLRRVEYGPHAGGIEIKYGLYLPIVSAVRLLSVIHHIGESSTGSRLRILEGMGVFSSTDVQTFLQDWANAIYLRAISAAEEKDDQLQSSGIIDASLISKPIYKAIKSGLQTARSLQRTAQEQLERRHGRADAT